MLKIFLLLVSFVLFSTAHADICNRNAGFIKELEYHISKNCKDISDDDLGKIERLSLAGHDWDNLKESDFEGLTAVTFISFNGGRFLNPPANLFKGLPNLKDLTFHWVAGLAAFPDSFLDSNTELESFYISTDDFGGGSTLLSKIPEKLFQNKVNLRYVRFLNTRIETIPENAFSGATSLEELDLGWNELTSIPPNICQNCNSLKKISLGAKVQYVDVEAFANIPNLEDVIFHYNKLSSQDKNRLRARYPKVKFHMP